MAAEAQWHTSLGITSRIAIAASGGAFFDTKQGPHNVTTNRKRVRRCIRLPYRERKL